jgi:hypothetical protein
MDWLYVLPDAGKRTTPDVTAAFTRTIHDCESAARQKYYRGYNQKGFHNSRPGPERSGLPSYPVLYERTLNFQRATRVCSELGFY